MGNLSPEERPVVGKISNEVRAEIESLLAAKRDEVLKVEKEKR